ncbi:MAG: hypothetical protein WKF96_07905 [Solirubrobacteraceae bacterium]
MNTRADQRRFVDRVADVEALLRALELRFNVLVTGERGAGTSSLLAAAATAAEERTDLPALLWVRAGRVATPGELLQVCAQALDPATSAPDGEQDALEALGAATTQRGPAVLLVDGLPSGRLAHAVYGRMRDELWQLGDVRWVVGLPAEEEPLALTPPADQFFELVHRVGPLPAAAAFDMLRHRDPEAQISDEALREIAAASGGNPSAALRMARAALVTPTAPRQAPADIVAAIGEHLGQPAARLAGELSAVGPSGPSDQALLARLGWSRPRAYQVFHELEEHGYVTAAHDRTGRPGRPRKLYRLREMSA